MEERQSSLWAWLPLGLWELRVLHSESPLLSPPGFASQPLSAARPEIGSFGICSSPLTPTPPGLAHPPSEPCQPVRAAPGSIVGSLLWSRQRCRSRSPFLSGSGWRRHCSVSELQRGRMPLPAPGWFLLTSHFGQAVPDLNGRLLQGFPYSPHLILVGLSKSFLTLSYRYLLCVLGRITFSF